MIGSRFADFPPPPSSRTCACDIDDDAMTICFFFNADENKKKDMSCNGAMMSRRFSLPAVMLARTDLMAQAPLPCRKHSPRATPDPHRDAWRAASREHY